MKRFLYPRELERGDVVEYCGQPREVTTTRRLSYAPDSDWVIEFVDGQVVLPAHRGLFTVRKGHTT